MPRIEGTNGFWLNSQHLVSIGLPVKHVFDDGEADVSWRIAVDGDGELVVQYVDGTTQSFLVKRGDTIVAVEHHLYASFAVRPGTPTGALETVGADEEEPQTQSGA